jgi:hypothetical protein
MIMTVTLHPSAVELTRAATMRSFEAMGAGICFDPRCRRADSRAVPPDTMAFMLGIASEVALGYTVAITRRRQLSPPRGFSKYDRRLSGSQPTLA